MFGISWRCRRDSDDLFYCVDVGGSAYCEQVYTEVRYLMSNEK